MNSKSPLLMIGVGGAGCAMVRGMLRACGGDVPRHVLADTDSSSARAPSPFVLLGGDRLSGLGSGGDIGQARLAAGDSLKLFDEPLEGVRLAVIVAALGGGTGGGASAEIAKHLSRNGIPCMVMATLPFAFEGEDRQRKARIAMPAIEEFASATVFMRLDNLVGDAATMEDAMRRAVDTLATGATLFWRLLEKPGYIRFDIERARKIVSAAGRGRFAAVSAEGGDRARKIVDSLASSPLLAGAASQPKSIVCGVLAGDDLRLAEVGEIADGVRDAFGRRAAFDLATVNDESTFSGRIAVVAMLFESGASGDGSSEPSGRRAKKSRNPLAPGPQGRRGRFNNVESTVWHGEDIDVPAFIRRGITLDI